MQPDELKAIRKAAGYSQEEFAERIGLSRVTVGLMERGQAPIEQRTAVAAQKLAHAITTIARHKGRIEKARALIDRIENHGMRFYSAAGDAPMTDVTATTLAEQYDEIRQAEEIIGMWEFDRPISPPSGT